MIYRVSDCLIRHRNSQQAGESVVMREEGGSKSQTEGGCNQDFCVSCGSGVVRSSITIV